MQLPSENCFLGGVSWWIWDLQPVHWPSTSRPCRLQPTNLERQSAMLLALTTGWMTMKVWCHPANVGAKLACRSAAGSWPSPLKNYRRFSGCAASNRIIGLYVFACFCFAKSFPDSIWQHTSPWTQVRVLFSAVSFRADVAAGSGNATNVTGFGVSHVRGALNLLRALQLFIASTGIGGGTYAHRTWCLLPKQCVHMCPLRVFYGMG